MKKIVTFLTYNDQAEAAARFYTGIFRNSRVTSTMPGPGGTVLAVNFELMGQSFSALNGGPSFKFSEGISLFVPCQSQEEIDELWDRLTAGGGKPGRCGWLTDKFGVSWQVVPIQLGSILGDKDPARAQRAMEAMLQMSKLDIAALEKARDGK